MRYTVSGEVKNVVNCHCGLCRKMNGAAFSTYVVVLEKDFSLESGELQVGNVSDKSTRHICARCGTPVFNANPVYEGLRILYFGSVDGALPLAPRVNIYCESQLDWIDSVTGLRSFDQVIA